jgi:hypothetical protein
LFSIGCFIHHYRPVKQAFDSKIRIAGENNLLKITAQRKKQYHKMVTSFIHRRLSDISISLSIAIFYLVIRTSGNVTPIILNFFSLVEQPHTNNLI